MSQIIVLIGTFKLKRILTECCDLIFLTITQGYYTQTEDICCMVRGTQILLTHLTHKVGIQYKLLSNI